MILNFFKSIFNGDGKSTASNQLMRFISGPIVIFLYPLYLTSAVQGFWLLMISVGAIAAFDSVIHLISMWYLSLRCGNCIRLNLPCECFESLCQTLKSSPALVQAQVPAHLQNISLDILDNNWFLTNNDSAPSTNNRSTKQGDPLADLFFSFSWPVSFRPFVRTCQLQVLV